MVGNLLSLSFYIPWCAVDKADRGEGWERELVEEGCTFSKGKKCRRGDAVAEYEPLELCGTQTAYDGWAPVARNPCAHGPVVEHETA